jgi:hypothetical protein
MTGSRQRTPRRDFKGVAKDQPASAHEDRAKPALAQEFVVRCARKPAGPRGVADAIGAEVDIRSWFRVRRIAPPKERSPISLGSARSPTPAWPSPGPGAPGSPPRAGGAHCARGAWRRDLADHRCGGAHVFDRACRSLDRSALACKKAPRLTHPQGAGAPAIRLGKGWTRGARQSANSNGAGQST